MKLICGLGNPSSDYVGTRHNVGFMALDALADKYNASYGVKSKFQAEITEITASDEVILLVKPLTFYNETGLSIRRITDFYKINPMHDLLVIHDDLALPFGTIRVRHKGSDAGNNGIKSLNTHMGQLYARLRTGIDSAGRIDDTSFVLGRFTSSEVKDLKAAIIPKHIELIHDFIAGKLKETSYTVL